MKRYNLDAHQTIDPIHPRSPLEPGDEGRLFAVEYPVQCLLVSFWDGSKPPANVVELQRTQYHFLSSNLLQLTREITQAKDGLF